MKNTNQAQAEDISVRSNQLVSLLMVLGSCAEHIEIEEMSASIFAAREIAKEIDTFVENVRLGK